MHSVSASSGARRNSSRPRSNSPILPGVVVSAKQNLNQRIKEIERELVFNEYSNMVGEIIVGEIYQIRRNEILINHNRNELILPKVEQIFKERYKKGDTIRAVLDREPRLVVHHLGLEARRAKDAASRELETRLRASLTATSETSRGMRP